MSDEPRQHQVGDFHEYQIVCKVCGEYGTLRLTIDPAERLTAEDIERRSASAKVNEAPK